MAQFLGGGKGGKEQYNHVIINTQRQLLNSLHAQKPNQFRNAWNEVVKDKGEDGCIAFKNTNTEKIEKNR